MGSRRRDQVNKLQSHSSKGGEETLDQEDHAPRFLDFCMSQVTQGSGDLDMTPSVLETRQRNMQNTPLPTRHLGSLVSSVICATTVLLPRQHAPAEASPAPDWIAPALCPMGGQS